MSIWMKRFRFATVRMWWVAIGPMASRWEAAAGRGRRAVEKPVQWKPWKTKNRFSTVPTGPWKSRNSSGISTFPQLRRRLLIRNLKDENPLRPAEGERQGQSGETGQITCE